MKKIILTLSFGLFGLLSFAQKMATIEGAFKKDKFTEVRLFKVDDGVPKQIATSQPNSKGKFGFNFAPDYEGLYLVGTGSANSPQDNYRFWLKPGDKLSLILTDSTYQLIGVANTKENQVLNQWYKMAWLTEWKSVYFMKTRSTYVDFFPVLEKLIPTANNWLKKQPLTGNKKFDASLKDIVNFDIAFYAMNFLHTPRSAHPDKEEVPDLYKNYTVAKIFPSTKYVYSQPYGLRAFSSILMRDISLANIKFNEKDRYNLDEELTLIKNDTLKGDYILNRLGGIKDFGIYAEKIKKYEQYILTDNQKDQEFKINSALATLKPGDKGYEFKYEDKNGKMVSFSDLKGKVVLIDTWATWCGPCKVEIPHLKKLEEEMKEKNVHIVSISVDEEKDKDKWKKMIEDDNLGGIQLFASGWSEFTKYYKINGIPRFLLFDKEGKIITVDAPRPSNPELKTLIEKYL